MSHPTDWPRMIDGLLAELSNAWHELDPEDMPRRSRREEWRRINRAIDDLTRDTQKFFLPKDAA